MVVRRVRAWAMLAVAAVVVTSATWVGGPVDAATVETGFTGRVTDSQGNAVANATVEVWSGDQDSYFSGSWASVTTTTDEQGRYTVARRAGWYQVRAYPPRAQQGFMTYSHSRNPIRVVAGSLTTANVKLRPAGVIKATVLTQTGKVVDPTYVSIGKCSVGMYVPWTPSDTRGGKVASVGTYEACITVDTNYAGLPYAQFRRTVTVEPGATVRLGTLRIPKSGKITGKLNFSGYAGSGGLDVELEPVGGWLKAGGKWGVAERGTVTFGNVAPGRYRVSVVGTNKSRIVTVKSGATTTFPTFSYALSSISGKVNAPAGQNVCVTIEWEYRCGTGTFSYWFGHLVSGDYLVDTSGGEYLTQPQATINLPSGGTHATKTFTMKSTRPLRTFSGKVVQPVDAPPAALVRLRTNVGTRYASSIEVRVKADGTFSTGRLTRVKTPFSVHDAFGHKLFSGTIAAGTDDVKRTIRLG